MIAKAFNGSAITHPYLNGDVTIYIRKEGRLFKNCQTPFTTIRNHREQITTLNADFEITAFSDSTAIESFENKKLSLYGVQFHPEKGYSESVGNTIFKNFLNKSGD
jgi:GMP synthase-like glutamine amidotransferase